MTALLVQQVTWEADGVISLTLCDPAGAALTEWEPGAHLDLILASGLTRQYSLVGDPADRTHYRVSVALDPASRGGSREIHSSALVGTVIGVEGPRNHFALVEAESYLFFAGGIGVTPIVPMVAAVAASGRPWHLVYGGRTRSTMAFVDDVTRRDPGSVTLVPEDEQGYPDFPAALDAAGDPGAIYACGPAAMLAALEAAVAERGWAGRLHVERFTAGALPLDPTELPGDDAPFTVECRRTGVSVEVPAGVGILDALRGVVPFVSSSCEEGYCGTCETRVLEGIPLHHDQILTDDERAKNDTMMICVGRSLTPTLVLDL